MLYKFKYKFLKTMLSDYLSSDELDLSVDNYNTFIDIETFDNYVELYVESEDKIRIDNAVGLIHELSVLQRLFNISRIAECLNLNETFTVGSETYFGITEVQAFGYPVILIGDNDLIEAVAIDGDFSNEDLESIFAGIVQFANERGFLDLDNLGAHVSGDILFRLDEVFREQNKDWLK